MVITDVVNAASHIGSGLPGYGIAQGSLFAVTGRGVGPDQPVQGTFPLTTGDGLGGVTVNVKVGSSTAFAIMVYVSSTEVDAILPSSTPLGAGTVTVNNNGVTSSAPLTVVASAFGIFTTFPGGFGPALAFQMNSDGSTSQNSSAQSAQNGQTILLNGTGLGAIQSDETQSGVTDVPNVNITIWVGNVQATLVSAGRGACCAGLDPSYPIPQGIAAWDVIQFVVPDGVSGCQVSVAIQIGKTVSNVAAIAIGPGGGTCPDLAALNLGDSVTLPEPYKYSLIFVSRLMTSTTIGTTSSSVLADNASAVFYSIDVGQPVRVYDLIYAAYLKATAGSCSVTLSSFNRTLPPPPTPPPSTAPKPIPLDAGPALTIVNAKESQAMPLKNNIYSAGAVITSITLPVGPPVTTGGPGFNEPGTWNLNNGAGGADIAGFNVQLQNPLPVAPVNFDQLNTIVRGQDLALSWTGGDPDGFMEISGSATSLSNTIIASGLWYCTVRTGDGHFTVPGYLTSMLPVVPPNTPTAGQGIINFTPIIIEFVNIPGVDLTNYISTWSIGKSVAYQ